MSALAVRNWVDDPQAVTADWLDWVRERIASGEWSMLIDFRYATLARGFWARGDWRASVQLSQAIWELLGQAEPKIAKEQRDFWDCRRFDALGAIEAEDWAAAEEIIRREIEELGTEAGDWQLTIIATIRGLPTPPEVVQAVKQKA